MTWKDDFNYGLAAFGLKIPDSLPLDELASRLGDVPCRNTVSLVLGSAVAFYAAERGHNPKVRDIYDALIYCSTCISVGYSDIFARTPVGKLIGSALMTLGPSMAASTLNGPGVALAHARQSTHRDVVQEEMLSTLQQILARLESRSDNASGSDALP